MIKCHSCLFLILQQQPVFDSFVICKFQNFLLILIKLFSHFDTEKGQKKKGHCKSDLGNIENSKKKKNNDFALLFSRYKKNKMNKFTNYEIKTYMTNLN